MSKRKLKFIFTSEEAILDKIRPTIESHELVTEVFEDSGYWYSNGETGPEWHSMHVCFDEPHQEAVEKHIASVLTSEGTSARLMLERDYSE